MDTDTHQKKLISVVSPCYNEELNVEDCYQGVKGFEGPLSHYDYEHIFSDNCSRDRTVEILRSIVAQDPRVKVILNARNFGPFASNYNALSASTSGDGVVVFMPADLQDPPELIPEFVALWEKGWRLSMLSGQAEERMADALGANGVLPSRERGFANIDIPIDASEFQFIDRVVVDALRQYDDYYPYIRGMIANCGFTVAGIEFTWRARKKGFSKNRFYHLIDQGLNGSISSPTLAMRSACSSGL